MVDPDPATCVEGHDATPFYEPWEVEVSSFEELVDFVGDTYDTWHARTRSFAWRGVTNSTWAFHSSLYRRLVVSGSPPPAEDRMLAREGSVLKQAHRWGLHREVGGRLSVLEQLAMMQHFGAPTRLIDVSFNPLIAAWFAVQEDKKHESCDGRLFAVDVTTRRISENDGLRSWADSLQRPWKFDTDENGPISKKAWTTGVFVWKPPGFFGRISRQNGGFLLGGVPASRTDDGPWQLPKGSDSALGWWRIADVRKNTSVAFRFHRADKPRTGDDVQPAYTVRIMAEAKGPIRNKLENLYGFTASTLYGDYPGFAEFVSP